MDCDEAGGGIPVDGLTGASVNTRGVGIEKDGFGGAVGGIFEVGGRFDAKGADDRDAVGLKLEYVCIGFIAMELGDVDQPCIEQGLRLIRPRIDEDADAEDAPLQPFQEAGLSWVEEALGFRPEVRPEGVDTEACKFLGIGGGGDAADLEGALVGIEECFEHAE